MQRGASSGRIHAISRQIRGCGPRHDVFINHRGVDTKRNVAGLLYQHLLGLRLHPFLDSKSMNPGDNLPEEIHAAIRGCKVGVAIISPTYCNSYFCLHELSSMVETGKSLVPIFCDVKPSELRVRNDGSCPDLELKRFRLALEEAKCTVGLTFDTIRGDWPRFLESAANAVIENLIQVEEDSIKGKTQKVV